MLLQKRGYANLGVYYHFRAISLKWEFDLDFGVKVIGSRSRSGVYSVLQHLWRCSYATLGVSRPFSGYDLELTFDLQVTLTIKVKVTSTTHTPKFISIHQILFEKRTVKIFSLIIQRKSFLALDLKLTFDLEVTLMLNVKPHTQPPYQVSVQSMHNFSSNTKLKILV